MQQQQQRRRRSGDEDCCVVADEDDLLGQREILAMGRERHLPREQQTLQGRGGSAKYGSSQKRPFGEGSERGYERNGNGMTGFRRGRMGSASGFWMQMQMLKRLQMLLAVGCLTKGKQSRKWKGLKVLRSGGK